MGRVREIGTRWLPAALLVGWLSGAVGCSESDEALTATPTSASTDFEAPVRARATLALEPEVLGVGEVATVEVLVVAPPSHRVSPVPTRNIEGVALLGARALPPEKSPQRWTHRTQFRIRPEAVGVFTWPALEIEILPEEGDPYRLELPARRFEAASVRDRFPDREQPFGLEELDDSADRGTSPGFLAGLALGVSLSALTALVWLLVRRTTEQRTERGATLERPVPLDLFEWTEHELAEALAVLDADPRRAATAGARLLRVYMARRFGSATESATTEELEQRTPALAERSAWPDFVRILHSFDDERFRRRSAETIVDARVRAALEDSRSLIETSRPASRPGNT